MKHFSTLKKQPLLDQNFEKQLEIQLTQRQSGSPGKRRWTL